VRGVYLQGGEHCRTERGYQVDLRWASLILHNSHYDGCLVSLCLLIFGHYSLSVPKIIAHVRTRTIPMALENRSCGRPSLVGVLASVGSSLLFGDQACSGSATKTTPTNESTIVIRQFSISIRRLTTAYHLIPWKRFPNKHPTHDSSSEWRQAKYSSKFRD
jgi:hypothetical protein